MPAAPVSAARAFPLTMKRRARIAYAFLAAAACGIAAGSYVVIAARPVAHAIAAPPAAVPVAAHTAAAPPAPRFEALLVREANGVAGDGAHVVEPHCVAADGGLYMCAYTVRKPGSADECHLMQARWTPERETPFLITLAGRTGRCSSVREAVESAS